MSQLRLITSKPGSAVPFIQKGNGYWNGLEVMEKGDPATAKEFITRELNIQRDHVRLSNKIKAISDPDAWLAERQSQLDEMATEVTEEYQKQLAFYYTRGYSAEECIARATEIANAIYKIKMAEIEATMPGSSEYVTDKNYEQKYRKMKANRGKPQVQGPQVQGPP